MPNILIVDDEDLIRDMLKDALSGKGYRILEAPNGKIAERMIFTEQFDLVISDIQMPEMDGIELLRRAQFSNPNTKFIIMTAHHKPENIPLCLQHNALRYMRKPFQFERLAALVRDSLDDKESANGSLAQTGKEGWLEMELATSIPSLKRIHDYIEQYLKDSIPEDEALKIAFSFYEMTKNAMEWGNLYNKERKVQVGCMILSDQVLFKIWDEGEGFGVADALNPIENPFDRQDARIKEGKRPGGYGIQITRKLMDDFFYNEKGNCLIMTKNRNDLQS